MSGSPSPPGVRPGTSRPSRNEIALLILLAMLLPSLLITPVQSTEQVKLTLATDAGLTKAPTSTLEYLHTRASGFPTNYTNSVSPTGTVTRNRNVTLIGGTLPLVSNVADNRFTVSWVMEVNGTGKVECSTDANMTSPASRWTGDTRVGIASAVAYINVTACGGANPLTGGVTVYWRAWFNTTGCTAACGFTGTQIQNVSWPGGRPFPAVLTKISTATQTGNPTITISPYEDRNGNSVYNAAGAPVCNGPGTGPAGDAPLCEFLVYANHSGAGTIAFRAQSSSTPARWTAYLDLDLFRDNGTAGAPHALIALDLVRLAVWGLYNNLTSPLRAPTLWVARQTYTCCGALGPPNAQPATAIPDFQGVGFGLERTWLTDPALTKERGMAGVFSTTHQELNGDGAPRVANLGTSSFRVAWTTNEPVKGMIQVGTSSTLAGASYFVDPRWVAFPCSNPANCIRNGTSVIDALNLAPGTRYYWRAVEDNGAGHNRSFPSTPPYPLVWTKTDSSAPPTTNPTLLIRPYADMDADGIQDPCIANQEYRLRNFTGFVTLISPVVSEPLAARGAGGSGSETNCGAGTGSPGLRNWRISINLNNLRRNTTLGSPITLTGGERFEMRISGLHTDTVAGRNLWKSKTDIRTLCSPLPGCAGGPITITVPTTRFWDFLGLDDRANHAFRLNATDPGYLGMIYLDTAESKLRDDLSNGEINDYIAVSLPSSAFAVAFGERDIAFSENGGRHWRGSRSPYLTSYRWYGGQMANITSGFAAGTEPDGTGYAVIMTVDGARWWTPIRLSSSSTANLRDLLFQGGVLMAVGAGTVTCTTNVGVSWSDHSNNIGATQYYGIASTGANVIVVGAGGRIIRQTSWPSCTDVWTVENTGGGDLFDVACGPTACLAAGAGRILRSLDGGDTWSASTDGHIGITRFNSVANDGGAVWLAVGEGGAVLRTTDDGATWTPQAQATTNTLNGVGVSGSARLLVGDGAAVVRNVSGGWALRSVPVGGRVQVSYQPEARRHTTPGVTYDSVNRTSRFEYREGLVLSTARTYNVTGHRPDQSVLLNDTFPTAGAPNVTNWPSATWPAVNNTCGSVSGANALHFDGTDQATTLTMNMAGVSHAEISFQIRRGDGTGGCGNSGDQDDDQELIMEYSTNGGTSWTCLAEYEPGANPQILRGCIFYEQLSEGWFPRTLALPTGAYSSTLQIRFRLQGTDVFDDFAIDDVVIRLRSRWIGSYMHQYDNEDVGATRYVVLMALANMTDPARDRNSTSRAHVRIYNYSATTLVYEADMVNTGIFTNHQRTWFTTGNLDWASFISWTQAQWMAADGVIFVAIVDTYDVSGASDASLGHISRKICFFQFDAN